MDQWRMSIDEGHAVQWAHRTWQHAQMASCWDRLVDVAHSTSRGAAAGNYATGLQLRECLHTWRKYNEVCFVNSHISLHAWSVYKLRSFQKMIEAFRSFLIELHRTAWASEASDHRARASALCMWRSAVTWGPLPVVNSISLQRSMLNKWRAVADQMLQGGHAVEWARTQHSSQQLRSALFRLAQWATIRK